MAVRLELERLEKRFAEDPVLAGVDLAVEPGQTLALLGPSGSGKTTALRIVAGFETADRGKVLVDGEDVSSLPPARRQFGMVFQHYALFPHLSVAQNVAFGLESLGWPKGRRGPRVGEMLELVGLAGLGERHIGELSGGQQQRVALARALAPSPRVLLLDEPLSNLDPALRERTRAQLRSTVDEVGITTVLVTHEQEEAFHLGDRVAVLHRGRLEQVGTPEEIYRAPASRFVAGFVGRASELRGRVTGIEGERLRVALDGTRANEADVVWDLPLPEGRSFSQGHPVVVVARPEVLEVVAGRSGDVLVGCPVESRFTGAVTFLRVETPCGLLEVAASARDALPSAESWGVSVRAGGPGPWVFPAESFRSSGDPIG